MRKTLKFAIVTLLIIVILSGNTAVLAKEIIDEVTSEKNTILEENTLSTEKVETEPKTVQESETTSPSLENNADNAQKENNIVEQKEKTEAVNETVPSNVVTEEPKSTLNIKTKEAVQSNENHTQSMSTQASGTVGGEAANEPATSNNEITTIETDLAKPINYEVDTSKLKGKLNISIDLRLPQKSITASDLTVTLKKSGIYDEGAPAKANGVEKEKQLFYTFDDLPEGEYTLTIQGIGYQTFSQANVTIKANTTTELHFTNGYDGLVVNDTSGDSMLGDGETTKKRKNWSYRNR